MDKKESKQKRTVIHLFIKSNGSHHYFGSIANIYEFYTVEDIGITYGSLRNYVISREKPYENQKVIIRKGILLSKSKSR